MCYSTEVYVPNRTCKDGSVVNEKTAEVVLFDFFSIFFIYKFNPLK